MSEGRPVPIHASGGGVVKDCIICGLPYKWHDQRPANWLACPGRERLVEIERDLENQLARLSAALAQNPHPRRRTVSIFSRFADWLTSGKVPDCPSCNGTGDDTRNYHEYTYWKGQLHRVCIQCKGSGKV